MRTPEALLRAVDQEDVTHNTLYVQGRIQPGTTWCNLFATRVAANLGITFPFVLVADQAKWIRSNEGGFKNGWRECNMVDARSRANSGFLVLAIWEGADVQHGHIAVLIPSYVLGNDKTEQIAIAQAGKTNFSRGKLDNGFDSLPTRFYTVD